MVSVGVNEIHTTVEPSENNISVVVSEQPITVGVVSSITYTNGATTFKALSDTPSTYTASYLVSVNSSGDAIEFVDPSSIGATTFLGLSDTPSSYTANYSVRANAAGDALEFFDPAYANTFAAIDAISSVTYSGDNITQIVYASGRTINYTYTSGVLTSKNDGVYQWDYTYTDGKLTSTTVTKL